MKKDKQTENLIPDYENIFGNMPKNKKKYTSILFDMMRPFGGKYIVSLFAFILKESPVWIMPVLTAAIIDVISVDNLQPEEALKKIILYGVLILVSLVQNCPTHMWYCSIVNKILRKFSAGLRSSLVRKLQHLSITYHKKMESGKLQAKFIRDIDAVNGLMTEVIITLTQTIIGLLVSIGISLYNSPLMTVFFIAIVPLNVFVVNLFEKKLAERSRDFRLENENVSASFTSILRMTTVTRAHGLEKKELSDFNRGVDKLTRSGLKVDRVTSFFHAWMWIVSNALSCLCLVVCAAAALYGYMTPGDVVLYQSLFAQINGNVSTLVSVLPTIVTGLESVKSIFEVMTSDDLEHEGKTELKTIRGQIDFDNVSYAYPDNPTAEVIKDFTLHVKPGECIAFVGSSGSGKTTAVNMIIGFLRATSGTLSIDGQNINELNMQEYRQHISVVPQNGILFPGTVRENITYGLDSYTEEQLQNAVEMANISEFLPELPQGLDTQVGEAGDKLSGGQKQRITIARALIRDPSVLILDEATSALDNVSEYHVQKAIEKSTKGRTTFVVAHRLSTIRNADRIVVMQNGRMEECGTYEELMALKGKFFELKTLSDMATKDIEAEQFLRE